MSLFNFHFDRPGPGVEKDAPPKKGIFRWWEIFVRNFNDMLLANICFLVCALPTLACLLMFYVTCAQGAPWVLMLVVNIPCAALLGPALAALHRLTLLMCRDIPFFTWYEFKKAFKQNFKQGALAMMLLAVLADMIIMNLYLMTVMENYPAFTVFMLLLSIYIWFSMFNTVFQQIALMELPLRTILKNSLLLIVVAGWRGVLVTLLDIVLTYFLAVYLLLVAPLALFGLLAIIVMTTDLILWPRLKQVFIDQNIPQRRRRRSAAQEWGEVAAAEEAKKKGRKQAAPSPDEQWAHAFLEEESAILADRAAAAQDGAPDILDPDAPEVPAAPEAAPAGDDTAPAPDGAAPADAPQAQDDPQA